MPKCTTLTRIVALAFVSLMGFEKARAYAKGYQPEEGTYEYTCARVVLNGFGVLSADQDPTAFHWFHTARVYYAAASLGIAIAILQVLGMLGVL